MLLVVSESFLENLCYLVYRRFFMECHVCLIELSGDKLHGLVMDGEQIFLCDDCFQEIKSEFPDLVHLMGEAQ